MRFSPFGMFRRKEAFARSAVRHSCQIDCELILTDSMVSYEGRLIDISIGFFEDMENKDRERLDIFRRKGQTKANGWTIFERKSSKDNEGKLFSNFLPEKFTKIGTNSLMKMKSIFSHRR